MALLVHVSLSLEGYCFPLNMTAAGQCTVASGRLPTSCTSRFRGVPLMGTRGWGRRPHRHLLWKQPVWGQEDGFPLVLAGRDPCVLPVKLARAGATAQAQPEPGVSGQSSDQRALEVRAAVPSSLG